MSVYQERTGAYHAPWCASFVTWALEQSGHSMPAGNWAAVANWVGAAQAGHGGPGDRLARPTRGPATSSPTTGASARTSAPTATSACSPPTSSDGAFEAIEGNYQDAVAHTSRSIDEANVVFIRVTA